MKYLTEGKALLLRGVVWEELAGPFKTYEAAEAYCISPPEDLGDAGTVTVMERNERSSYPYYVFRAEATKGV